ncbi:MAG: sigma factor-like helix-turn-helix DNA-binding protein [Patescibacteria group bacterium]
MKYNIDKIVNSLLVDLSARQKEVLAGRFGLHSAGTMTLAKIGDKYHVTRERVRQIEALSLTAIKPQLAKGECGQLVIHLKNHFKKLGGLRRDDLLCDELKKELDGGKAEFYGNKLRFLLRSCGAFEYRPEDNSYYAFWHIGKDSSNGADNLVVKLENFLRSKKTELIINNNFKPLFTQVVKSAKLKPALATNYISISKKFTVNSANELGLVAWSEISPKTARDWAYLVLRKNGQPLHFSMLTNAINKIRNDKITNAQTVHNELIKDSRFVLVGRGTYGLQEFNLMAGTAREVIHQIIDKHGPQISKDVVRLVLNQRDFKENTLLLNLQDKNHFQRLDDGKYAIKKV